MSVHKKVLVFFPEFYFAAPYEIAYVMQSFFSASYLEF